MELCISMASLDVMLFVPSEERGRNRHGRHTYTDLKTLERFVFLMYERYSAVTGVDKARLYMFARKQRPYLSIPPTQAALRDHAKLDAGVI